MGIIKYQKKDDMEIQVMPNGVRRAEMLAGAVDGVHTYKCLVSVGETVELEVFGDTTQLIYITSGECYLTTKNKAFMVTEPSLFIPNMDLETNTLHAVTDVEYLQLTCFMLPEDHEWWHKWHITLPRFCPLSQCIQYTEGFRPEGIKAYSILDTHFVTRMTMGAIIGEGPNIADPHSHNNLYQWYYGMPGTKFLYKAGEEQIELTEGDFAFIPIGIEHAIEIKEHETVNYVWFEIEVPKNL